MQPHAFIGARNFTRIAGVRKVDVVVLHTFESPRTESRARNVALWMAGPTAPRASYHYLIDNREVIQAVAEGNVAWQAVGANHNGIGIGHAGYASQSRAAWQDNYSGPQLALSQRVCARIVGAYQIPVVALSAADLRAGRRGITTHAAAWQAFGGEFRSDPGAGFPMDLYLAAVRDLVGGPGAELRAKTGFWSWLAWYEGREEWRDFGRRNPAVRPAVPATIPAEWWERRETWVRNQQPPTPQSLEEIIREELRARVGFWSWLAWYEGREEWRDFGPRNRAVRPDVPLTIPAVWWERRETWVKNQKGG